MEKVNYLKAEGSYTKFVTENKEYIVSNNLTNVTAQINHHLFLRIHRSYVVNLEKVTGLDNDYLFFGKEHIPISRNYKEEVNKHLKRIS
jgi:DNA-binding LytR/AlgR family response regulator